MKNYRVIKFLLQKFGKEFDKHFGKGGCKLLNMTDRDFNSIVEPLLLKMRDCQKEPGNLKECTTWMSDFKPEFLRTELEVPGKLWFQLVIGRIFFRC